MLLHAYDAYCLENGKGGGGKREILGRKKGESKEKVWLAVAQSFQFRTVRSVFRRARRLLSEVDNQGKWSKEEKTALLSLYDRYGPSWKKIAEELGRLAENVSVVGSRLVSKRARSLAAVGKITKQETGDVSSGEENEADGDSGYNSESSNDSVVRQAPSGHWSRDEEQSLVNAVKLLGRSVNKGYADIPWRRVAEIVKRRDRETCTAKWARDCARLLDYPWDASLDRVLVDAILEDGGERKEEVAWDTLVEGWQAAPVKAAWDALVKRYPRLTNAPFDKQVLALSKIVK